MQFVCSFKQAVSGDTKIVDLDPVIPDYSCPDQSVYENNNNNILLHFCIFHTLTKLVLKIKA